MKKKLKQLKKAIDDIKRPALEFHHEDLHIVMDENQARIEAKLDLIMNSIIELQKDVAVLKESNDVSIKPVEPTPAPPYDYLKPNIWCHHTGNEISLDSQHVPVTNYEMTNFTVLGDA